MSRQMVGAIVGLLVHALLAGSFLPDASIGVEAADRAAEVAAQLNAQWAPNSPAFTAESVEQQRGPDRFAGFGGVVIGNTIAMTLAKSMLAAPNNTLTPEEALALATQQGWTRDRARAGGAGA